MSTLQEINLPPVPTTAGILQKEQTSFISQPWNQWLITLRNKVNAINDVVVAISGAGTPLGAFNALSPLTTNGDMLTYNAGNNIRLPIGTSGQVLTVVGGLPSWQTFSGGSPLTTKGDLYTFSTVNTRLPVGTNGQVLTANNSTSTGLAWAPNTPTLPLTTKGDILGYDTSPDRIPVGTNGQVLTADSTNSLGVSWQTPGGFSNPMTTSGDIIVGGTSGTPQRLPIGTTGQVLTVGAGGVDGLVWSTPGAGASYSSVVLADSPVGFWKLAETSGTSAADSSGNSLTGTYHGSPIFLGPTGVANLSGGVILNSSSYISVAANSLINVHLSWSLEGWTLLNSISTASYVIGAVYTGSGPLPFGVGVNIQGTSAGQFSGGYYTGSSWMTVVGPSFSGTLTHVVLTYNGTVLLLYINGSLVASVTPGSAQVAANNGLNLGAGGNGPLYFTNGILSCCAIYNTVLTPARILVHYLTGR